jgi:hypothetical protein
LLLAKNAQEKFLRSILENEGKHWTEFYKYVKRRKGNRENILAMKDGNGRLITDSIEKAKSFNFYYSSAFSCERSIPQIQRANSGESFAIGIKIIRIKLAAIGRNKSVGPDSVSGEILKMGGKAMIPYLARLLDMTIKKGNGNTKGLAYTSLVLPILEYGAACWDPYRKGQINALDQVQNMAPKFAHHGNDSNWENLIQRRKRARICALFKAYTRERAWKAIGDRLLEPCYLSRVGCDRSRKQKRDIGKYSFVSRTMQLCNQLPADALGSLSCKSSYFRKRVRKVINKAK